MFQSLEALRRIYQQYEVGQVGYLHEYLQRINSYAENQATDLEKWLADENFRRKWLQMLQSITAFIEKNYRRFKISDNCFASVTRAVTVQLYGYVAECIHGKKILDGKRIVRFINAASQCFNRKFKLKDCFGLLETFITLLYQNQITNVADYELREFVQTQLSAITTANKNNTIITLAHIFHIFADLLISTVEDISPMFGIIDVLIQQLQGNSGSCSHDQPAMCLKLIDVISLAVKFRDRYADRDDITEEQEQNIRDWIDIKEKCAKKLTCHKRNECVIHKKGADWRKCLTKPFYDFDNSEKLDRNISVSNMFANCSCDVQESQNDRNLLSAAMDIFCVSSMLQGNLVARKRKNRLKINAKIEHISDENTAVTRLLNAAKAINDLLQAYVNNEMVLSAEEFNFCLRAIRFIKNHLLLLNYHNHDHDTYTFPLLLDVTKKTLDNESKLNLAATIAEYSNEYSNSLTELDAFFKECEGLTSSQGTAPATDNFAAFMGLMYKRRKEDDQGNKHLEPIMGKDIYKIVRIEYLATIEPRLSGDELVNPKDDLHNPQIYIKSLEVTENFYQNDDAIKMLSAALLAIMKAKRDSQTTSDNAALLSIFITNVVDVCKQLGLQKQTVNLLLIRGSLQMDEPDKFWKTLNDIEQNLTIKSICFGVPLEHPDDPFSHPNGCSCPMCSCVNEPVKSYISRYRSLCQEFQERHQ